MPKFIRKYSFLAFLLPALALTNAYITLPQEFEWGILLFLSIMVVFDKVNLKVFAGFGYSFFNVILSLIIFDRFTIVYGFLYLLIDCLLSILMQKSGRLQTHLSLLSIYVVIIIICNEIYNGYSDKDYLARYLILLLMLSLSVIFKYFYVYIETGAATTKLFLDRFAPMLFELVVVFPILSFFDHLETNLVLILFLSYYTFIGWFHKKFMAINQANIDLLTNSFAEKYNIEFIFTNLAGMKGIYHAGKNIIFIEENLDYPEQLQTIIHEVLHLQLRKFRFPAKLEEFIVTIFEAALSWYCIMTAKHKHALE